MSFDEAFQGMGESLNTRDRYSPTLGLMTSLLRDKLTGGAHLNSKFRSKDMAKLDFALANIKRKREIAEMQAKDKETVDWLSAIGKAVETLENFREFALDSEDGYPTTAEAAVPQLMIDLIAYSKVFYKSGAMDEKFDGALFDMNVDKPFFVVLSLKLIIVGAFFESTAGRQFAGLGPIKKEFAIYDWKDYLTEFLSTPYFNSVFRFFQRQKKTRKVSARIKRTKTLGSSILENIGQNPNMHRAASHGATRFTRGFDGQKLATKRKKALIRSMFSIQHIMRKYTRQKYDLAVGNVSLSPKDFSQVFLERYTSPTQMTNGEVTMLRKKKTGNLVSVVSYVVGKDQLHLAAIMYSDARLELVTTGPEGKEFSHSMDIRFWEEYAAIEEITGDVDISVAPYGVKMQLLDAYIIICFTWWDGASGRLVLVDLNDLSIKQIVSTPTGISSIDIGGAMIGVGYSSGVIRAYLLDDDTLRLQPGQIFEEHPHYDNLPNFGPKFLVIEQLQLVVVYNEGEGPSILDEEAASTSNLHFYTREGKDAKKQGVVRIPASHGKSTFVTSLLMNYGELYVGTNQGSILIYDVKTMRLTYSIENAHHGIEKLSPGLKRPTNPNMADDRSVSNKSMVDKQGPFRRAANLFMKRPKLKRAPLAVTSLSIENDILISTGSNGALHAWNLLSPFQELEPIVLPESATDFDRTQSSLTVGDNFVYFLCTSRFTTHLARFKIAGLLFMEKNEDESDNISKSGFIGMGESVRSLGLGTSQPKVTGGFTKGIKTVEVSERFPNLPQEVEDQRKYKTIGQICGDPSTLRKFRKFLEEKAAYENIEFYLAANKYKNLFEDSPLSLRFREGRKIIRRFVETASPREINIPNDMRNALVALNEPEKFTRNVFDDAIFEIDDLMEQNFLFEFMQRYSHLMARDRST